MADVASSSATAPQLPPPSTIPTAPARSEDARGMSTRSGNLGHRGPSRVPPFPRPYSDSLAREDRSLPDPAQPLVASQRTVKRKRAASIDVEEANRPRTVPFPLASDDGEGKICLCTPAPKIRRPRNSFILYRQAHQAQIVAENPTLANPEVSKIIGRRWQEEPQDVKQKWKRLADEDKRNHLEQYPDYKYQPRRDRKLRAGGALRTPLSADTASGRPECCPKCGGRYITTPSNLSTPSTPSFALQKMTLSSAASSPTGPARAPALVDPRAAEHVNLAALSRNIQSSPYSVAPPSAAGSLASGRAVGRHGDAAPELAPPSSREYSRPWPGSVAAMPPGGPRPHNEYGGHMQSSPLPHDVRRGSYGTVSGHPPPSAGTYWASGPQQHPRPPSPLASLQHRRQQSYNSMPPPPALPPIASLTSPRSPPPGAPYHLNATSPPLPRLQTQAPLSPLRSGPGPNLYSYSQPRPRMPMSPQRPMLSGHAQQYSPVQPQYHHQRPQISEPTRQHNQQPTARALSQREIEARSVEALVMSIPYTDKLCYMNDKLGGPLAPPAPGSPGAALVETRGPIIAIEGAHPSLMAAVANAVADALALASNDKSTTDEYAVRVWSDGKPVVDGAIRGARQQQDRRGESVAGQAENSPVNKGKHKADDGPALKAGDSGSKRHKGDDDRDVDAITAASSTASSNAKVGAEAPADTSERRRERSRSVSSTSSSRSMSAWTDPRGSHPSAIQAYLQIIEGWHLKSEDIVRFVTKRPTVAGPSPAVRSSDISLSSSSSPPSALTQSETLDASAAAKDIIPVALLSGYRLSIADRFACTVPIQDSWTPNDHWGWMASLWRGIVGPDLVVYVRRIRDNPTRNGFGAVEVKDPRLIVVRVPSGMGVGADLDEDTGRRLRFEIGEWMRKKSFREGYRDI